MALAVSTVAERFRSVLSADRVIDHPLERGLYARDGSITAGDCGLVVLPDTAGEVAECMRLARDLELAWSSRGDRARAWPAVRSPRGRAGRLARPHAADRPGRPGHPVRLGRARRAQPGPDRGRGPPGPALRARPLQPAGVLDRRQRRPPTPAARTAWRPGSRLAVLGLEMVTGTARSCGWAASPPTRPGTTCAAVVGGEGTVGVVTGLRAPHRNPPEVRTMLLDFPTVRAAGEAVGGIVAAA